MARNQSILLTVFLILIVAFTIVGYCYNGCTFIEPKNVAMYDSVSEFVKAVEQNDFTTAFSFLTKEAQSQVDYGQFSSTPADFEGVVAAFRKAGIEKRNKRPKDEPTFRVSRLRGHESMVTFIPVLEEGRYKIANLYEGYLKSSFD